MSAIETARAIVDILALKALRDLNYPPLVRLGYASENPFGERNKSATQYYRVEGETNLGCQIFVGERHFPPTVRVLELPPCTREGLSVFLEAKEGVSPKKAKGITETIFGDGKENEKKKIISGLMIFDPQSRTTIILQSSEIDIFDNKPRSIKIPDSKEGPLSMVFDFSPVHSALIGKIPEVLPEVGVTAYDSARGEEVPLKSRLLNRYRVQVYDGNNGETLHLGWANSEDDAKQESIKRRKGFRRKGINAWVEVVDLETGAVVVKDNKGRFTIRVFERATGRPLHTASAGSEKQAKRKARLVVRVFDSKEKKDVSI